MKHILRDFLWSLTSLFSQEKNAASILMYHSIGDNNAFFTVREEGFEKQLDFLYQQNFTVISLLELIKRIKQKESLAHTVVITFDDGYKDNYDVAFPLLKKYKMPATIFLTTDYIGSSMKLKGGMVLPMVSKKEIQEMVESGYVEFMPHTKSHVRYTVDNLESFLQEVRESRKIVETLTGRSASFFAYPAGKYDQTLVESIKKEGFDGAVTVEEGLVYAQSDFFVLKRNAVDSMTSMTAFKGKVSSAVEWYERLKLWK